MSSFGATVSSTKRLEEPWFLNPYFADFQQRPVGHKIKISRVIRCHLRVLDPSGSLLDHATTLVLSIDLS